MVANKSLDSVSRHLASSMRRRGLYATLLGIIAWLDALHKVCECTSESIVDNPNGIPYVWNHGGNLQASRQSDALSDDEDESWLSVRQEGEGATLFLAVGTTPGNVTMSLELHFDRKGEVVSWDIFAGDYPGKDGHVQMLLKVFDAFVKDDQQRMEGRELARARRFTLEDRSSQWGEVTDTSSHWDEVGERIEERLAA